MLSRKLIIVFALVVLSAIGIAMLGGISTYREAPPYPEKVVSAAGELIADKDTILRGQANFQKYGLMDLGSVWGHGTYRGTEFTADTLHRIGQELRVFYAREEYRTAYSELAEDQRALVDNMAIRDLKTNRYDAATGTLTLTPAGVYAYERIVEHWNQVFSKGAPESTIRPNTIKGESDRKDLGAFFYWTAWAAGTQRPGETFTYTNNWPPDETVGNRLSSSALIWTVGSILVFMLFLGAGVFIYHWWKLHGGHSSERHPEMGPELTKAPVTQSQVKAAKFFLVVVALFVVQTTFGGLMAHYTVHPNGFYMMDRMPDWIPYNLAKTFHLQLAVFWIALSWIGATIYLGPLLSGREPRKQGLLVDLLWIAALAVAVGSLAGEVLGVKGLAGKHWFWLGHQGWEYLELGRLWQILLTAGLVLWLYIVARAIKGTVPKGQTGWGLPQFLGCAAVMVVGFYGWGLLYDPGTHLTIADFWRWWVVHSWVEGVFEFFAVAAMAMVMVSIGLAGRREALLAAYTTAMMALFTGIIGVGHHYYWFGNPSMWLALGGVISAMEPVPILLVLGKSWQEYRAIRKEGREFPYTWPLLFVTASGVWAFIGAGVLGFLITTPAVNYYEHSTYLTLTHGHPALFGTYGMLAIGLMLFALRGLVRPEKWNDKLLALSFWGLNIGLTLMTFGTLLPVGFAQLKDSFINGLWHARSPEFYNEPFVQLIGQARVVPDTILIVFGAIPLALFVIRAMTRLKKAESPDTGTAWTPPVKSEETEKVLSS